MKWVFSLTVLGVCWSAGLVGGAPFPAEQGEALIKAAVVRANASMVRIETVGGTDIVEGTLVGTGATTGVIVSADGYIITSSFNFATNPSSILVTLPESSQRLIGEIVARDHLKQLTLLKVDAENLTPATAVPVEQIQVGQWALALGRTYDAALPNISLGLVSALGRMEGKAIQTDAKVSPANYGGPLVDLAGNVLGILSPLSPQGKGLTEGMNWYDSGIGFAIPLAEIQEKLPELQAGTDLQPGLVGISFLGTPAFLTEPVIQEVRPNSPASEAGLQPQDRVLSVAGKPVTTVAGIRQVIGRKYAGDLLPLVVQRGETEISTELTLAERLQAFHFGWLGLLTSPVVAAGQGVEIRHVFPGSAAEAAGLKKQDRITAVDEMEIETLAQLRSLLLLKPQGQTVNLQWSRDGETLAADILLKEMPEAVPEEVPLPVTEIAEDSTPVETGDIRRQVEGDERSYQLYVPEAYRPEEAYGCLVWLSAGGESIPADQLSEWKRLCRTRGFLLVVPQSEEIQPWTADDTSWLLKVVSEVTGRYAVDPEKVCLVTAGNNPTYLWQLAFEQRERFRGVLAFGLPTRFRVPYNEPGQRLQVLLTVRSEKDRELEAKMQEYLQKEAFPVSRWQPEQAWSSADFDAFGRWLELLGSL